MAQAGLVASSHDCAEGGLAVTLAECCFDAGLGVEVNVPAVPESAAGFATVQTLFGESASRVVCQRAAGAGAGSAGARGAGRCAGQRDRVASAARASACPSTVRWLWTLPLADAESAWATAIQRRFERNGQS